MTKKLKKETPHFSHLVLFRLNSTYAVHQKPTTQTQLWSCMLEDNVLVPSSKTKSEKYSMRGNMVL